jgi:predicted RNA-binding Zn-ribbon protein involved in translation (DUF1610 family)
VTAKNLLSFETVTLPCPRCGSHDIHHSRYRTWFERARWRVTGRVPYRCHDCEWRGWRSDAAVRVSGESLRRIHRDLTEAELERLDPERRARE